MTEIKNDLTGLRENYSLAALLEKDMKNDPILQFENWMQQAIKSNIQEPNAMVLSTMTEEGYPAGRVVLLKEIINGDFVFYTNYNSSKSLEIEFNPKVSLSFLWKGLQRQIRIQGTATKVSREISKTYFDKRPRESRIGAWVSPQSQIIENREFLINEKIKYDNQFEDIEEVPLPPNWGGYAVRPVSIEFWQGRPSRLHDRIKYLRTKKNIWTMQRLAP